MRGILCRTCLVAGLAILAGLFSGCGGAGVQVPSGNQAIRSSSLGGYQSFGAGVAYPFAGLAASAPQGSGIHMISMFSPRFRPYVVHSAVLQFVPELNLYTDGGVVSSGGETFHYFTDSAGTTAAGSMVLVSSSGSFDYPSYPATVTITVNVTAGNLPCHGDATIVYAGSSGSNTLQGTLTLTKNSEVITVDMTLDSNMQVGGTMTIVENGTTISATNLSGLVTGDINFNFTLQPQGFSGTGTMNLGAAVLALTFTNPANASCSVDGSGNLIITYPDGTNETVQSPFSAPLLGGSGGGGNGGGGGASNANFATAVAVDWNTPVQYSAAKQIFGSDSAGEIVGKVSGVPAFAASPTAVPQTLVATPQTGTAYSINSSREIVGAVGTAGNLQAVVWTSPSATATTLQVPAGTTDSMATGINASGQIIGVVYGSSYTGPVYWSSYQAAPAQVPQAPPINGAFPSQIDDNGHLYGNNGSGYNYVWPSPTTSPTVITTLHPADNHPQIIGPFSFSSKGLVGASEVNFGQGFATFWAPPGYTAQPVPLTSSVQYSQLYAIDNQGEMTGWFQPTGGTVRAGFWQPGKTQMDITAMVTAVNPSATTAVGEIVLNDGSLIVSGKDSIGNLLGFYYLKRQ